MTTPCSIGLIVGLGNPGAQYEQTRHNVGMWLLERLAEQHQAIWQQERKFQGAVSAIAIQNQKIILLRPSTFMNNSGRAVQAVMQFYKLQASQLLVMHDELDFTPGVARIKWAGGVGGHNGLKDIAQSLNTLDFWRVRLGIGHPGSREQVTGYVLTSPSKDEKIQINHALDQTLSVLPDLIAGHTEQAINQLHSTT